MSSKLPSRNASYAQVQDSDDDEEEEAHHQNEPSSKDTNDTDDANAHNAVELATTDVEREESASPVSPLEVPELSPTGTRRSSWKGSGDRFRVQLKDEWYIRFGGLHPPVSYFGVTMVYWVFMVANIIISIVHIVYNADDGDCLMVGFLVESFQLQSLALYSIIYKLIDTEVLNMVTESINGLEYRHKMRKKELMAFILFKGDPKPIHLVHNQMVLTAVIIIPSYLSGFCKFVVLMDGDWKDCTALDYMEMASNVLNFIRYFPLIIHIAIVRSYYHIVQYHLADLLEEFKIAKHYKPGNQSDIGHRELMMRCEEFLKPYRTFTEKLQYFVVVHFGFNVVALTLVFFVALEMFGGGHCDNGFNELSNIANFVHYMIELMCFVALWVFLLMPIVTSHKHMKDRLVGRMLRKSHSNPTEKAVIDSYLRSLTNYSPFEIMGKTPTYDQIAQIMYAVAVAVVSGAYAVFQDVTEDCDDAWGNVMSDCGTTWGNTTWYNEVCNG